MGVKVEYARHGRACYRDARWPGLRIAAKRRDDYRCCKCGARGLLEVDHIRAVRDAPELAFELSNLQTLCRTCHTKKTNAETGFCPLAPERARWRSLLRQPISSATQPKTEKELQCLSP